MPKYLIFDAKGGRSEGLLCSSVSVNGDFLLDLSLILIDQLSMKYQ